MSASQNPLSPLSSCRLAASSSSDLPPSYCSPPDEYGGAPPDYRSASGPVVDPSTPRSSLSPTASQCRAAEATSSQLAGCSAAQYSASLDQSSTTRGRPAERASAVPQPYAAESPAPVDPPTTLSIPANIPRGRLEKKPRKPKLKINVERLPSLLSSEVFYDRLASWADPELGSDIQLREDIPPWSLTLESFYGMYHPATWVLLERDQSEQKAYLFLLALWRAQKIEEDGEPSEGGELWEEMVAVQKQMSTRFAKLYALHYVRNRYLDFYRAVASGMSDGEIIYATLQLEDNKICEVPQNSLWPLPCSIPSLPDYPILKTLTRIANLPRRKLPPYTVFPVDPRYHQHFRPTSPSDFAATVLANKPDAPSLPRPGSQQAYPGAATSSKSVSSASKGVMEKTAAGSRAVEAVKQSGMMREKAMARNGENGASMEKRRA